MLDLLLSEVDFILVDAVLESLNALILVGVDRLVGSDFLAI